MTLRCDAMCAFADVSNLDGANLSRELANRHSEWNPTRIKSERDSGDQNKPLHPGRLLGPARGRNADKLCTATAAMRSAKKAFGQTRWSLVLRAADSSAPESRVALEELCRAYRPPLRQLAGWIERNPERAEDLVQDFLTHVVEKNVVAKADPARGQFRTFLRASLHNYARNLRKKEASLKHGGAVRFIEADLGELVSNIPRADLLYDKLWARTLLDRAVARLGVEQTQAGNSAFFDVLRDRLEGDVHGNTLREAAAQLNTSEGALKVRLFSLRRRFAELVEAEAAETVERAEHAKAELYHLLEVLREEP
jgi:RNA polymerase sigma factor (sigma-70 family)